MEIPDFVYISLGDKIKSRNLPLDLCFQVWENLKNMQHTGIQICFQTGFRSKWAQKCTGLGAMSEIGEQYYKNLTNLYKSI